MHEEEFVWKNRKGKRIQATLRTAYGKPKGTMVLLHGLGGWKDQYLLVVVAEAARSIGYHVYTFNAADGARGLDADFSRSTTTEYLHDLEDVIEHVRGEKWFVGPIMLAAHSQGGLVALRYTRMHQDDVSRLILMAPAVSWKIGLASTLPFGLWWLISNRFWTPGPGPARTKLLLRRPWLLDYMTYNAPKDAREVSVPTLLISAGRDGTVGKPSVHERMMNHMKKSTHKIVSGANHIFYKHEQEVADIVLAWLTSS